MSFERCELLEDPFNRLRRGVVFEAIQNRSGSEVLRSVRWNQYRKQLDNVPRNDSSRDPSASYAPARLFKALMYLGSSLSASSQSSMTLSCCGGLKFT